MIGPNDLLEAIVERLQAVLDPGVSIEAHEGTFDEREMERYGSACPAVRVAVTGFGGITRSSSGEMEVPLAIAAVCLAKDVQPSGAPKIPKRVGVQALALSVALAVDKRQFGLSGVYPPEAMLARNQYSARADQIGIAIWQVLWTTRVITGAALDLSLAALSQLYVGDVLFSGPDAAQGADPLKDGAIQHVVTGAGTPPDAP